jgi:hypothetical protein
MNLAEYHICFGDIYYNPNPLPDVEGLESQFVCHLDTALTMHDIFLSLQRFDQAQQESRS